MLFIGLYFVFINIFAIFMTVFDKTAALNNERRISEKTLLFIAAIGGGAGMYFTMRIIHHKTRKNKFMLGIPAIILLELAALVFLYLKFF